jgi:2-methylcitrate dehydratase
MTRQPAGPSWVESLADWALAAARRPVPADVLHAATRQTLDSVACAAGAVGEKPARAVREVAAALGGVPEASLLFAGQRSSIGTAVLYNATLVRALDCNDIFFTSSPRGHPSDNLAVALAAAERQHSTGRQYLTALALGYELDWRLQEYLRNGKAGRASWDYVSMGGIVGAAMFALLLGLGPVQFAHALAIAGAQTYTVGQVRAGEISMLKASAGAIVSRTAVLAPLLAQAGMTGPRELLEGEDGVLRALGLDPDPELRAELLRPVEHWHIRDVTIKPYPAIGTSQAAIAATLNLVAEHHPRPQDVARLEVHLPDTPITRRHLADRARNRPTTRESADHSIPFLLAVSLQDGDVGPGQFAGQRWLDAGTVALMDRVTQVADPALSADGRHGYPAVVILETRDGARYTSVMSAAPGSPARPLSDEELSAKLGRLGGARLSGAAAAALAAELLAVDRAADMAVAAAALFAPTPGDLQC